MINKKIVLHFPRSLVNEPIVYKLIKDFNLSFNILKAQILPDREGLMVMELHGTQEDYKKGVEYLKNSAVDIQSLSKDIKRDDKKCTHCGVCVAMCPTDALRINRDTREVIFDSDKCIACELCIDPCPTRAMSLHF
ncbi:MAG: 4Fe-4S binding protein [Elusimicrobiota bacterium]|nr:4Fe-4S binding protein [Elusimicrobiota bacterium]